MADHEVFDAGDARLQCGITLKGAKLAYKTYGSLDSEKSNVVVFPTRFSGRHSDNEYLIGPGLALDPARYFIIVPNLFGNGVSSSPSNTPIPFNAGRFPNCTIYDNVMVQRRLLSERFGIDRVALAVGWSMGAQQAYQWAALWPDKVARLAAICGAARCAPHNFVFLDGMRAALTADAAWNSGWYKEPPAVGRVGWWEWLFQQRDANNLLTLIWTGQHADISVNDVYKGDFGRALGAIQARTVIMPCRTDLYFPPADNDEEVKRIPRAELRLIDSVWGHYAGGGRDKDSLQVIDTALKELLAH
jgi:homoserine O-acetyltransferase